MLDTYREKQDKRNTLKNQKSNQKSAEGYIKKLKITSKLTDQEYEKLVKRLEFNDTMRNNLLTFSFSVVLATLGIALQVELDMGSVWFCLLPFLLIIPFTARISYYRLSSAHISAFLRSNAKNRVLFEKWAQKVSEKDGIGCMYNRIAFLVNHEMVLLAIASGLVFYIQYIPLIKDSHYCAYMGLLAPVPFISLVFAINHSTSDYSGMVYRYLNLRFRK